MIEIEKSHGTTKLISDTHDSGSTLLAHQRQQSQPLPPPPPCCCQQIDYDDEEEEDNNARLMQEDDYDEVEGRYSPKKVTFSDYDQVKLMSMESLLSAATSDASTMEEVNGIGQMSGVPLRSVPTRQSAPTVVLKDPTMFSGNPNTTSDTNTPKRNQKAQVRSGLV